ncbi:MAG: transcriptional repressor [Verrucomicrobiales bacterium]|nr:transcriptional repressor [Verrucomicrobiales bacterium]
MNGITALQLYSAISGCFFLLVSIRVRSWLTLRGGFLVAPLMVTCYVFRMDAPDVMAKIIGFMEGQGMRITAQRRVIVEAAFNTAEHYTAENLLERSRKIDPSVSRATVYRTLPVLVKTGLLRELDLGKDQTYYDPNYVNHPNHNHIICNDCGKIVEFEDYCLDVRESVIAKNLGFRAGAVKLRIEAACEQLAKTGECARRGL